MDLSALALPIVQAPLAGGPSTPELAAAVSAAGGLGFLAAGYRTAESVRSDIAAVRALTDAPFGVNIFVPSPGPADQAAVQAYAGRLRGESERYGVPLGAPVADDDGWRGKLDVVTAERVPVVSFTFGTPPREVAGELRASGCLVLVTVTTPDEAVAAYESGADALVAQGVEAGGHRGGFTDDDTDFGLLALLRLVLRATPLPVVAAGGIADGAGVAAVLAAGAVAAQLGTAFLRTPEAGTSPAHREALGSRRLTAVTRAFTGRRARGLVNRFLREHTAEAPSAYPQVHHLTAPLRAAARRAGDAEGVNLWAGQGHALAEEVPAGELVRRLATEAAEALDRAARRWR
ncbi:oxidoreductase [Sphaerisporangium melleum]|uniref:Probable nitronate monooxygenase n=1 Tax=Sphaerisporangium melleum TaxID=321316 RepID=A0A917R7K5_9ACTN|nr:nitronate monooxygenase [Sphaerisporangium melleum]GGK93912.1 oxidoreductase [Sphaerisporangium melleum]GII73364.1 oxidoreductase [Sphaerisporangium melleum]